MPSFPVWSSPVEYLHVQCITVVISFIRKRGMQLGADQCSEVQWLSCMVLSSSIQSSEVKLRLRQSSPVKYGAVQFSLLKCCPAQSSPVQSSPLHWRAVQSIQWNLRPSSPIPIHSLPAKYISIQRRPGSYKSTAVESSLVQSSAVQSSAIRNSSAQSRPVPSRPVPFSPEQLTAVESSTTQSCSVKLGTTKCIAARPVKWSAIRKSPHWSPYKCISVQSCLQLSHQHNQERLPTALSYTDLF